MGFKDEKEFHDTFYECVRVMGKLMPYYRGYNAYHLLEFTQRYLCESPDTKDAMVIALQKKEGENE